MIKIETKEGKCKSRCEGTPMDIVADLGIIVYTVVNALYKCGVDDAAELAANVTRYACDDAKRQRESVIGRP